MALLITAAGGNGHARTHLDADLDRWGRQPNWATLTERLTQVRDGARHRATLNAWLDPVGAAIITRALVGDALRALASSGTGPVVVAPIGFVSDHMEVVYDLDTEARELAADLAIPMIRAATAGVHPAFVDMIRQLITERLDPGTPKLALGDHGPYHDVCRPGCCPRPARPAHPAR